MKILSPVSNLLSLKMAVFNGANEVYLGINSFNARNNVESFNLDSLKDAVDFAHIHNVKVNLAINILFSNSELQSALNTLIEAYNIGVDAFIVQDLGLIYLISQNYPQIELHASTQMGLHNVEGIKQLEKYNIKRVVLSRETPLAEVKRIKDNCNVEIEYFAQGALCVSFSGNCYMSSYLHNASGNRGKCKQLCRLPYTLKKDGTIIKTGYLLSTKDLNMSNKLNELQNAGVDVLKIEGRARRPYYVGVATREYYNALHGKSVNEDELKLAFNRDYTEGYLYDNSQIISKYNNHIGINIGKIDKVEKGNNFNMVYFTSKRKLSPKSTFKTFKDDTESGTFTAYDLKTIDGNHYIATTTQNLQAGDDINLIIDFASEESMLNMTKKRKLDIELTVSAGRPLKAKIAVFDKVIEVTGDIAQVAQNQPLQKQDFIDNFQKSEYFDANITFEKLDNVFMQKQKFNEFRRRVFEHAYNAITQSFRHNLSPIKVDTKYKPMIFKDYEYISDLRYVLSKPSIVYSPEVYNLQDIKKFVERCQKEGKIPYLDTPYFATKEDINLINNIIANCKIGIIANNYYALSFDTYKIIGGGLNVYNSVTASIYDLPIIPAEMSIASPLRQPLMTLRHCPMKEHLSCTCENCAYQNGYTYTNEIGKEFKLKRKKLVSCTFYLE